MTTSTTSKRKAIDPNQMRIEFGTSFKLVKSEELKESDVKNDTHQESNNEFKDWWLVDFSWLKYNKVTQQMFCKTCVAYLEWQKENQVPSNELVGNSFVKGCTNFKKTAMDRHITIDEHITARVHFENRKEKPIDLIHYNGQQNIEATLLNPREKLQFQTMLPLFRTIYYVASENLPMVQYERLNNFQNIQGLEMGPNYICTNSGKEILEYISENIKKDLLNDLQKSSFIGFALDKSQDTATQDNLVIVVRYLKDNFAQEKYLKLLQMKKGGAEPIFKAVYKIFEESKLVSKIIGLSTDGEKTMAGKIDGVTGRFKTRIPQLIHFHCLPHKLLLQVRDVMDSSSKPSEALKFLYLLCKFFNSTSKKVQLLLDNEILEGDEDCETNLKLIVPFEVRWLSSYAAIERMRKLFVPVYHAFESLQKEKDELIGKALFVKFQSFETISTLILIEDLLEPAYILTKSLQKNCLTIEEVNFTSRCCINKLEMFAEGLVGKNLEEFLTNLVPQLSNVAIYKGCKIIHSGSLEEEKTKTKELLKDLASQLVVSFKEWFDCYPMLKNFEALEIQTIKTQNSQKIDEYGKSCIEKIVTFFNGKFRQYNMFKEKKIALFDKTNVISQYQEFKRLIRNEYHNLDHSQLYAKFLASEAHKDLKGIIEIYLVLPITSVECERSFSQMNLIKTPVRSNLEAGTLDHLMRLRMHKVSLENFDFEKPFLDWKSAKKRYFI